MLPSAIYPRASEHSLSLFRVHPASLCAICAFVHHLHLCAPSVPLCTICISVCHLRLCVPSASLCAICHLFLCLFPTLPLLLPHTPPPLPPLHTAIATAAHRLCCCCTPPPVFTPFVLFFVLVAQPTIVATEMGGLLPHNGLHLCVSHAIQVLSITKSSKVMQKIT